MSQPQALAQIQPNTATILKKDQHLQQCDRECPHHCQQNRKGQPICRPSLPVGLGQHHDLTNCCVHPHPVPCLQRHQ
eukprot:3543622-Ditylum_brightwellii.AAC.1